MRGQSRLAFGGFGGGGVHHSVIRRAPQQKDKVFENGDHYSGGWENGSPEGEGKYEWADGSVYEGQWKAGKKHGRGCYRWPNNATYRGDWLGGRMHGVGRFDAPDGSRYDGSWVEDRKQGLGRKAYPNGDVYEGMWHGGRPDGPGRYVWATATEYDGEWLRGRMHGKGTLKWATGERYDGEWRDGKEDGIGVFTWRDGATFEGFWRAGCKNGVGVFRPAASSFRTQRTRNRGDSDGDLAAVVTSPSPEAPAPADTVQPPAATTNAGGVSGGEAGDATLSPEAVVVGGGRGGSSSRPAAAATEQDLVDRRNQSYGSVADLPLGAPQLSPTVAPGAGAAASTDGVAPSGAGIAAAEGGSAAAAGGAGTGAKEPDKVCFVRHYEEGVLVAEEKLTAEEEDAIFGPLRERRERRRAQRKSRRRLRESKAGEKIYKGHRSYDLMLSLQLGVRYSLQRSGPAYAAAAAAAAAAATAAELPAVGSAAATARATANGEGGPRAGVEEGPLPDTAFSDKVKLFFPHDGSRDTPPHPGNDFTWTDYCPNVFGKLRELFHIDSSQYLRSLGGDQALRELSSPGKSGSVFFISHDDKYLAKTVRREEMKLLMDLLPRYYEHVRTHHHTLLVKFFGLHKVKPKNGQRVRFIVMNNVFMTDLPIHCTYDLKGSTYGRSAGAGAKAGSIFKDLDLDVQFKLEEGWHERLMLQLQADAALLEELRVMDYSLLLGVHFRAREHYSSAQPTDLETEDEAGGGGNTSGNGVMSGRALTLRGGGGGGGCGAAVGRGGGGGAEGLSPRPPSHSRGHSGEGLGVTQGSGGLMEPDLAPHASGSAAGGGDSDAATPTGGVSPPAAVTPTAATAAAAAAGVTADEGSTAAAPAAARGGGSRLRGPSMDDLDRITDKLRNEFKKDVSRQSLQDLMKLASFRMLGPSPSLRDGGAPAAGGGKGLQRSATLVLAQRPQRSNTLRPIAGAQGGTDDLTAALGHKIVQLGGNMAAVALPMQSPAPGGAAGALALPATASTGGRSSSMDLDGGVGGGTGGGDAVPEDVILYFGIIDILQEFNTRKMLESGLRRTLRSASEISAVGPGRYAKRFVDFMHRVFG